MMKLCGVHFIPEDELGRDWAVVGGGISVSASCVRETREKLGLRAIWRKIVGADGIYELRDPMNSYWLDFGHQKMDLRKKIHFFGTYLFENQ